MHFCKATIALGEDIRNVAIRDEYSPISWPEMEVIRAMHGDGSVTQIIPFVAVPQSSRAERQRLSLIYGDAPCAAVWGGRSGPSEMEAPEATLRPGVTWINPISGETEVTGANANSYAPPLGEPEDDVPFDPPADKIATKKR